jgi:hypothetical protein
VSDDTAVRLHIYQELADRARAPSVEETARALDRESEDVAEAYRRLADGHVIVLHPGTTDIWMANPFSAKPTSFMVRSGGREWWGTCAWDAPGILAMLDGDGTVSTRCPDCDEPLELRVAGGRMAGPEGAVAHFAVPAAKWWEDIGFT